MKCFQYSGTRVESLCTYNQGEFIKPRNVIKELC